MDLLSRRYASPFFVLDEFIRLEQLHDYVGEMYNIISEEKEEEIKWSYYLHKVFDKSYSEWLNDIPQQVNEHEMNEEEIKNVVDDSHAILDLFDI